MNSIASKETQNRKNFDAMATKFAKKSTKVARRKGTICVSYNRVSSKEQMVNGNSLDWQNEQIQQYATKNNLVIKATYGGTFESAKTDERKEFQRMLADIKKDKSIASIVVYCYDRFSRSGANGIFLLENLRALGIRIIAVSQEIDSETPTGMFQENLFMLLSKLDNDMRKDKSVSGTKSMLKKGYWPYHLPIGYENVNLHTPADRHEYVINKDGLLLQQAFKWKASGTYSNIEIVEKLRAKGLRITLRNLAWVFVNTFYCGYINSSLLPGEMIKGKQPPLIDEETFMKANNVAKLNPRAGIARKQKADQLPLKVFAKDAISLSPFTGYLHKQKNIYYYKARVQGACVNVGAKRLNDLFLEELKKYEFSKQEKAKLIDSITLMFRDALNDKQENKGLNNKRISELQNILSQLEERFILGEITKEQFQKFNDKFKSEKLILEDENSKAAILSSNLEKAIKKAIAIAQNISRMWLLADFDEKQKLQYLIFPEGIMYKKENNTVLTNKVNGVFAAIPLLSMVSENKKGDDSVENHLLGSNVVRPGFEPRQTESESVVLPLHNRTICVLGRRKYGVLRKQ